MFLLSHMRNIGYVGAPSIKLSNSCPAERFSQLVGHYGLVVVSDMLCARAV
jgi:hypothetical protein